MMKPIVKPANPQGKGLVGVLDSLQQAKKHLQVPPKHIQQISDELFTSLFVLSSEIRFKPTPNNTYYLYSKNNRYQLSLIASEQWLQKKSGRFIGTCNLQNDLTWTLALSDDCANDPNFLRQVAYQRQQLEAKMQQAEKIDDVLPVYVETLPFHARILAAALASSLKQSMQKSGIYGLSLQQAQTTLLDRHPSKPSAKSED
ncbi:MAG: hypothetical protein BVN35_14780 [Proteobacteria bacterium ST_bin11]|nr:MAG: hypothetical protein BVN35_14780 [Proteobacteria bacterium ST_bin11]